MTLAFYLTDDSLCDDADGSCRWKDDGCRGGNWKPGKCQGPADRVCCVKDKKDYYGYMKKYWRDDGYRRYKRGFRYGGYRKYYGYGSVSTFVKI